jgi:formyl-CoA transferase
MTPEDTVVLPLAGIRVLDLTALLPGPACSWYLADMGADVIRVQEPPAARARRRGTTAEDLVERRAGAIYNRNKRSLALDLKDERGRAVFYRLVDQADVVLEAFRPGVAARLGIDYPTLAARNPRLIYASISAYGPEGPLRDAPGFDPCACALAGLVAVSSDRHGEPVVFGVPVADIAAGLHAAFGIVCALRARDATGQGQHVDVSLLDAAMAFMGLHAARYFQTGIVTRRDHVSLTVLPPLRTKDGRYIVVVPEEPKHWAGLCHALGHPEWLDAQHAAPERRRAVRQALEAAAATLTRDEWLALGRAHDLPVAPVLEVDEVFAHPQVQARRLVLGINESAGVPSRQLGFPIKLDRTPPRYRGPAPARGAHTDAILAEAGLDAAEIAALRAAGVVA